VPVGRLLVKRTAKNTGGIVRVSGSVVEGASAVEQLIVVDQLARVGLVGWLIVHRVIQ
jgi:hypothetical protein